MCHTERLESSVDAAIAMAVTNAIAPARTDSTVSLVLTGRHLDVTGTDLNLSLPPWPAPTKPWGKTSRCRTRIWLQSGPA